jgi:protein-tyrosine-phosphatase
MRKENLKILFVCVENACRSQMAQGFAEAFGKGKLEVYSAGSRPSKGAYQIEAGHCTVIHGLRGCMTGALHPLSI